MTATPSTEQTLRPAVGAPHWRWLAGGLLAAGAAVLIDPTIAAVASGPAVRDTLGAAIKATEPIHALLLVLGVLISMSTARRRWAGLKRALLFWGAGLLAQGLVEYGPRIAPDSGRDALLAVARFLIPIFGWLMILSLLGLYPNRKRMWAGFLTPVLIATAITHLMKWAIGRARPDTDLGLLHFSPFHDGDGALESFPSGHSSAAMTLALALSIYFPRGRWIFLAFALMIGAERMISDKHYLSDVLGGFTVAAAAVWLSVRLLGPRFYVHEAEAEPG